MQVPREDVWLCCVPYLCPNSVVCGRMVIKLRYESSQVSGKTLYLGSWAESVVVLLSRHGMLLSRAARRGEKEYDWD